MLDPTIPVMQLSIICPRTLPACWMQFEISGLKMPSELFAAAFGVYDG